MPSSSYAKSKRSEVDTEGVWGVRDVVGDGDGDEWWGKSSRRGDEDGGDNEDEHVGSWDKGDREGSPGGGLG